MNKLLILFVMLYQAVGNQPESDTQSAPLDQAYIFARGTIILDMDELDLPTNETKIIAQDTQSDPSMLASALNSLMASLSKSFIGEVYQLLQESDIVSAEIQSQEIRKLTSSAIATVARAIDRQLSTNVQKQTQEQAFDVLIKYDGEETNTSIIESTLAEVLSVFGGSLAQALDFDFMSDVHLTIEHVEDAQDTSQEDQTDLLMSVLSSGDVLQADAAFIDALSKRDSQLLVPIFVSAFQNESLSQTLHDVIIDIYQEGNDTDELILSITYENLVQDHPQDFEKFLTDLIAEIASTGKGITGLSYAIEFAFTIQTGGVRQVFSSALSNVVSDLGCEAVGPIIFKAQELAGPMESFLVKVLSEENEKFVECLQVGEKLASNGD